MTIREQLELRELEYLSSYAALSKDSKGRKRKEEPCDIRPAFHFKDQQSGNPCVMWRYHEG